MLLSYSLLTMSGHNPHVSRQSRCTASVVLHSAASDGHSQLKERSGCICNCKLSFKRWHCVVVAETNTYLLPQGHRGVLLTPLMPSCAYWGRYIYSIIKLRHAPVVGAPALAARGAGLLADGAHCGAAGAVLRPEGALAKGVSTRLFGGNRSYLYHCITSLEDQPTSEL